ncbi:MAG: hypothetical protein HY509_00865 [Acidobacteria bacterium]|nr:hypothetical protein [Acidobacteriota bacterium]
MRGMCFFLLAISLLRCSPSGKGEPVPPSGSEPTGPGRGNLEGVVRWEGGQAPSPTSVRNTTDPESCGAVQSLEDLLVSPETGGIQNVILALDGVPPEQVPPFRPRPLRLDNRDCRFHPHAGVLETGAVIEITNGDPFHHTTHFYGTLEANVSLPFQGMTVRKTASSAGMIVVKCDLHGWMQAFLRVDPHPYHAVTGPDGSFRIPDIPAGTYGLEIWHERLGASQGSVTIETGKTQSLEIPLSPRER